MIIDRILKEFGSKAELSAVLGVSRSAVTQWGVDGVPPLQAIRIERITGGKIKAIDITKKVKNNESENV